MSTKKRTKKVTENTFIEEPSNPSFIEQSTIQIPEPEFVEEKTQKVVEIEEIIDTDPKTLMRNLASFLGQQPRDLILKYTVDATDVNSLQREYYIKSKPQKFRNRRIFQKRMFK